MHPVTVYDAARRVHEHATTARPQDRVVVHHRARRGARRVARRAAAAVRTLPRLTRPTSGRPAPERSPQRPTVDPRSAADGRLAAA